MSSAAEILPVRFYSQTPSTRRGANRVAGWIPRRCRLPLVRVPGSRFFSLISGHFLASSLPLESVYHVIHLVVNGPRLYTLFFSILTKRSNINKDVYILVTLLLYIQLALLHYVRIIIIGICSTQLLINVKEKDKVKDFV